MLHMQSNGRLFNKDWQISVYSTFLKLILVTEDAREEWTVSYNQKINKWTMNSEILDGNCSVSLSFHGSTYFLSLTTPTTAYMYEIEEISEIVDKTAGIGVDRVVEHFITQKSALKRPRKYYLGILQSSNCFSQIKSFDTLGRKIVRWKVNKKELSNFQKIKASVQNIVIKVSSEKEEARIFYTPHKELE